MLKAIKNHIICNVILISVALMITCFITVDYDVLSHLRYFLTSMEDFGKNFRIAYVILQLPIFTVAYGMEKY